MIYLNGLKVRFTNMWDNNKIETTHGFENAKQAY